MNSDQATTHDCIRSLLSAIANASLYSLSHPQVTRLIDDTASQLIPLLEATPLITVICVDGELIINGQPQESTLFFSRFTGILQKNGITHLTFSSGISRQELASLVAELAQPNEYDHTVSWPHITAGQVEVSLNGARLPASPTHGNGRGAPGSMSTSREVALTLSDMPMEEMARFREIYETVKQKKKLRITGIASVVSGFVDAFQQQGDALLTMSALRSADEYTFTHSTNVCILTIAQAMALGIEGEQLRDFGIAAMLHDIGKLYIPEEIVTKKGSLTPEEFDIMKQHPVLGARHLLGTPGVPRLAVTAAFEHHRKFNGSGYPQTGANWQSNLCSQMTMIADFFDALRTRRSYREPVDLPTIAGMMLDMSGKEFHPALTKNFLRILARLMPATTEPAPQ